MERDLPGGFGGAGHEGTFRMRRRNVTDYGSTYVQWIRHRQPRYKGGIFMEAERPSPSYIVDMIPPIARAGHAADCVPAKLLHSSLNKIKHPVNVVAWTPEGRRLLTASSSGEFTLWNGMGFNFETILQAHDTAIRATVYSHNEDWLVSGDQDGVIKYWQTNFNNVKAIQAHTDPIRDLAFSPNDGKFVTASDDSNLKIFDFAAGSEELVLTDHGWDVKSVDWHPTKGLLVSGSKDHLVKLWDPRTGRCLTTLHGHKNMIAKTKFEPSQGQLLATCARDQTARVFDLRMMRDICLLRGHEKDISTLVWHPVHSSLLSTGGSDGCIYHYLLDEPNTPEGTATSLPPYESGDPANAPAQTIYPAHKIQNAHMFPVWSMAWHPLGHILASGSNDRHTRFWTRARPGETRCFKDEYHVGVEQATANGIYDKRGAKRAFREDEAQEFEDEAGGLEDQQMPSKQPTLPGLPGLTLPSPGGAALNGMNGAPQQLPFLSAPPPPPPQFNGINGAPPFAVPPPMPNLPSNIANIDPGRLNNILGNSRIPPPPLPLPPHAHGAAPFPPPPSGFDFSKIPPGLIPPGFPPPPPLHGHQAPVPPPMHGLPPQTGQVPPPPMNGPVPPTPSAFGALPGLGPNGNDMSQAGAVNGNGAGSIRRRGPLPSQQESLQQEMGRGSYRRKW